MYFERKKHKVKETDKWNGRIKNSKHYLPNCVKQNIKAKDIDKHNLKTRRMSDTLKLQ